MARGIDMASEGFHAAITFMVSTVSKEHTFNGAIAKFTFCVQNVGNKNT